MTARLAILAAALTACSSSTQIVVDRALPPPTASTVTTTSTPTTPATPSTPPPTLPALINPLETPINGQVLFSIDLGRVADIGNPETAGSHDQFVAAALADIETWISHHSEAVYGIPFEPLEGGVIVGYPDRTDPLRGCPDGGTTYEDLQHYAAFYCPYGDFIILDGGDGPGSFLMPLADTFGPALLGVVLSHEYAHAIQERVGALDLTYSTLITEQQADCIAGAWTAHAYRGESTYLRLGDADVRTGLLAMLEVRDPLGTTEFLADAHGSAFDRVGAFQVGFHDGPQRCATLLDDPLPVVPNRFNNVGDEALGGNAPYDCSELLAAGFTPEAVEACVPAPIFLANDLNDFWRTELGADFSDVTPLAISHLDELDCVDARVLTTELVVCPSTRSVGYVEPAVREMYRQFGDFTLGYLYGIGWADIVFDDLDSTLIGERRALAGDCATGAWVGDITPDLHGFARREPDFDGDGESDAIYSSPGDLDEAIEMAILEGDPAANTNRVGSPFEKIAAFRDGVLGGLAACEMTVAQR